MADRKSNPRKKIARKSALNRAGARSATGRYPQISVIVPMFNEEANIDLFYERVRRVLEGAGLRFEIICVDDGSRDRTPMLLRELGRKDPRVKALVLSRNFGKDIALSAGLDYAGGEWIVPIDADLQDPPELIPVMLEKAGKEYDVVFASRSRRQGENLLKKITAGAFYSIMRRLTSIDIPHNTGDFRLIHRRVLEAIGRLEERHRFMKGLFSWVGFRQIGIDYVRDSRAAGSTKWNYWKLWNFALEGITSFSSIPLRVWSYLGLIISMTSFLYAGFLFFRTLIHGIDVPGYASMMVVILFIGGVQLITLGIFGEYIGRIFEEVKKRPLYLVRESYGFRRGSQRRKQTNII